jgi:anaerobic selenocysteine-containing dehydrogenase
MTERTSICRVCNNMCPVLVEVDDGRLIGVRGDPENEIFRGYSCVKGRSQPAVYSDPNRLLHSQKRLPDGSSVPISVETAMDEVAERLATIIDHHGPRSVAGYFGTYVTRAPPRTRCSAPSWQRSARR